MKRIWIIFLAFLFVYGGGAWALEACLHSEGHSDHATAWHFPDSRSHDDSADPSVPIIHCTPVIQEIGPAAQAGFAHLVRSREGIPFHGSFFLAVLCPASQNSLWREALFKKLVRFSSYIDLPRHLFLSVLQI